MSPELNIAHKAALKASKSIEQIIFQNELLSVQKKLQNDYVDKAVEVSLNDLFYTLKRAYPDDVVRSENGLLSDRQDGIRTWHIEPLAGTANFLYDIPHCAIGLVLTEQDKLQHAMVFQPLTGDSFTASRGKGAFLNNKRLRIDQNKELAAAIIATNLPENDSLTAAHGLSLRNINKQVAGSRLLGCDILDLAWVAAGRLDGFWQADAAKITTMVGQLFMTEAGGQCSDFSLKQNPDKNGHLLAANLKLSAQLSQQINPNFQRR
ncbi:inositol monophosphatase [Marinicella pacifica]|uniref:Inositol monophosphatase n=1 Tax=Marinicella pacifica TaxID=1171543 RepID=A0A917CEK9_9GAMM|nr:inositol monophosphatase family protein [Marinicella pacifica]GGF84141.1 inositol monophosphatase [Marinicella pacifica]